MADAVLRGRAETPVVPEDKPAVENTTKEEKNQNEEKEKKEEKKEKTIVCGQIVHAQKADSGKQLFENVDFACSDCLCCELK